MVGSLSSFTLLNVHLDLHAYGSSLFHVCFGYDPIMLHVFTAKHWIHVVVNDVFQLRWLQVSSRSLLDSSHMFLEVSICLNYLMLELDCDVVSWGVAE